MRGRCSLRPQYNKTEDSQQPKRVFGLQNITAEYDPDALYDAAITKKVYKGLLWKFIVLAFICYIDRVSLAYAAPQLNADLNFSGTQYGIGAGLFFVGYIVFQLPSNLILIRVGARLWLGVLCIVWGVTATQFAFMTSTAQFYGLRVLLGFAEAGTMPGMWYTLTLFFSPEELTTAWSWMLFGLAFSQILGSPLAAGLLKLHAFGIHGWRWMFILEGVATVLYGIYCMFALADSPATAKFLTPAEQAWLTERHMRQQQRSADGSMWPGMKKAWQDYRTWHLTLMMLTSNFPKWAIMYWCPLIVNAMLGGGSGHPPNPSVVALLAGLPFATYALFVIVNAWHSQRTGERIWHCAVPLLLAGCTLLLLAWAMHSSLLGLAFPALLLSSLVFAPDPIMASWTATFLQDSAAATGSATINSIGSIGGLVGPILMGMLEDRTGGFTVSMIVLAGVTFVDAALAICFPRGRAGGLPKDEEQSEFLGAVERSDADSHGQERLGSEQGSP